MKYTEIDVKNYLTSDGVSLDDYIVILGEGDVYDVLYILHQNALFFDIIEDEDMYKACIEYIKSRGAVYTKSAFKIKFPDIYL